MDHLGVLTRTVKDAGFLASTLGRRPELDIRKDVGDFVPNIGFCETPQWDAAEHSTQSLLRDAASRLGKAGAKVSDITLPEIFASLANAHGRAMDYEVSFTGLFDVINHPDRVSAKYRERFNAGMNVLAQDYDQALDQARRSRTALSDAMGECDVLICPSAPGEAPVGLDATGDPVFNRIWTFSGVPCINVPGLVGPNNMPLGLQVIARFGDDARALKAAEWISRHLV